MNAQERPMQPHREDRAEEGPRDVRGGRPEAVRIWLLGGFRVSVGTHTVEESAWRLRKAAALVKLLALAPGHHFHRERAMDLLWPNLGRKAAANNLSQALHAVRRALGPAAGAASGFVASRGEQLVLCPGGELWLDVDAFEEAVATARRSREPAAYRAALNLYAGELLPRDPYEEWAEDRREGLRQLFLALLVELASLHEERGEYGPAVEVLRRAVTEEETMEKAHAGLMRQYALSGRRGEALGQYELLEKILSRELSAEPSVAGRRLYEEIASGRFPPVEPPPAADSAPQEDASAGKDNLPARRTSFVGQEREIGEAKRALAMTRLLTLTGVGGSGKTRLALEVARDCVGAYPDGVWLVELAGLSEESLVPQAVAAALGVAEQPGRPITDALVGALRDKQLLLMVDNCEHLIEAAARLVDALLDSCPRLRVLATSREPLELAGEVKRPVPPLSAPDPGHPPPVGELEGYGSVRLFVERGRNKAAGFALTSENAGAIAELCRRLEGIPLAIELAAARVGVLSVDQISEGLKDPLRFLRAGNRTAAPRQRTLRGALDWSHELLGGPERELFRKLSVFVGGFSLEAAEAVGSGGAVEEDVLALLPMLVDKSLVTVQADGTARYGMLEPVRQYAREKLEASGEADAVKRTHAEYFLTLAQEAEPELKGGVRQRAWLERLEADHDNLRAAISWSLDDEPEQALRLAAALARFWEIRSYLSEGSGWLETVLRRNGGADAALRARAATEAGTFAWCQANYDRAIAFHREALALYQDLGDERGVAFALVCLGCQELEKGNYERASPPLEEALALGRKLGDELISAYALNNLGEVARVRGEYERAIACGEEALSTYREMEDGFQTAQTLSWLGGAAAINGDHEAATRFIGEGLPLAQQLGSGEVSAMCLEALAVVYGAKAEGTRAARLYGAAEVLRLTIGAPLPPADLPERERHLATARATLDAASWEAAWADGRAMTPEQAAEYAFSEEKAAPPAAPSPERPPASEQTAKLSRREKGVAELLARGLTNRRIAEELFLSERTVENHVRNILKKLNLSSRSEVAAWVGAQLS